MDNKSCTSCNIKIQKDKNKKDRTICKKCYSRMKRNVIKSIVREKQNNDNNASVSACENHGYVIVGPSNVGKT